MSKRLQIRLTDLEMANLLRLAKRENLRVGEWVRRALREASASRMGVDPEMKLKSVKRAAQYSFPTADVAQMLSEIERVTRVDLHRFHHSVLQDEHPGDVRLED